MSKWLHVAGQMFFVYEEVILATFRIPIRNTVHANKFPTRNSDEKQSGLYMCWLNKRLRFQESKISQQKSVFKVVEVAADLL